MRTTLACFLAFVLGGCTESSRPAVPDLVEAGVTDATRPDAATLDGGSEFCLPPEGCRYVNRTLTTCGTLVCGDGGGATDGGFPAPDGGIACGGLSGVLCPPGYRCQPPASDPCGEGEEAGVCVPLPSGDPSECTAGPVCGCNGMDYATDCAAWMADTDVRRYQSCFRLTCLDVGCPSELDVCTACATSTGDAYQCLALGEACD